MTVRFLNGETAEVNAEYAQHLMEQGKAALVAEEAEMPKTDEKPKTKARKADDA